MADSDFFSLFMDLVTFPGLLGGCTHARTYHPSARYHPFLEDETSKRRTSGVAWDPLLIEKAYAPQDPL